MEKQYEIWCKTQIEGTEETKMFWCKTIYQKWNEEDYSFRRRAKRELKKYCEKHQANNRKFYLLEN